MSENFTTTFSVDKPVQDVFSAITNVRGWWSEAIEGGTDKLGDEFTYRYANAHRCKLRLTELVPGERVVYHVLDNYFNFTEDETEWIGTELRFGISAEGGKTTVHFVHHGLVPEYECYDICTKSWSFYVGSSLKSLITSGKGKPNPK
jgi:uncharacterized protein YndB with AHSA1/START domain